MNTLYMGCILLALSLVRVQQSYSETFIVETAGNISQGKLLKFNPLRTLPARLASRLYLVYNLSWGGKNTAFLTLPLVYFITA